MIAAPGDSPQTMNRRLLLPFLALFPFLAHAAPQWVWTSKDAKPNEKATFRQTFSVSDDVKKAVLTLTCDNGATAQLNGKVAAENRDWNAPATADVKTLLKPGENELSIEGRNNTGTAALLATLTIETMDGKKQTIETGPDWMFAPVGSTDFKPVVVIAKYGAGPWGNPFDPKKKKAGRPEPPPSAPTDPATLQVLPGFKVELLYTVPKAEQGSWVSMTVDPKGRLIVCDQYGGLYRVTLGASAGVKVEPLDVQMGGAHGLLYAFGSLYVMVNETPANVKTKLEHGIWRLRDSDGDDHFETPELLRKIDGGGEHGPHGIALGPDGKSIYFAGGNHTKTSD